MKSIGHYKIIGSTVKDYRKYPIFADITEDFHNQPVLKIEVMENKNHNYPIGDFAMFLHGVAGMGTEYWVNSRKNFITWEIRPEKIDKFFKLLEIKIKKKYKSFRIEIDDEKLHELKILAKI